MNQRILTLSSKIDVVDCALKSPTGLLRGTTTGGESRLSAEREEQFKVIVVATILDSRPEEGIRMLCEHFGVEAPKLGVGVFEGRTKGVAAVYSLQKKEILAAKREYLYDPFVMIHEFYHHLRSVSGKHRGTERQADKFAAEFMEAYRKAAARVRAMQETGWTWTSESTKRQ